MSETKKRLSLRTHVLEVLMIGLFIVSIGTLVLSGYYRFETGELVLTEDGCQALAVHGVSAEPIANTSLCHLRAQYDFSHRTDRFGTVRTDSTHGRIDITLSGSQLVSRTSE